MIKFNNNLIIFINLNYHSVGADESRTAVLGPSAALTVHRTVIHYRVARYANPHPPDGIFQFTLVFCRGGCPSSARLDFIDLYWCHLVGVGALDNPKA